MPRRFDEPPALCHNRWPVPPPRAALRFALLAWPAEMGLVTTA